MWFLPTGRSAQRRLFYLHVELLYQKLGPRLGKCISIDVVTHGDSAIVNHTKMGTLAQWDDVARDIGLVVHHCTNQHGLIGHNVFVGHSMGGMCGMVLAALEPALFDGIVALDPIFNASSTIGPVLEIQVKHAGWTRRGKDTFKTAADCEKFFRKRSCPDWDPRVKDYFVAAAYVEMPDGTVRTKANIANPLFGTIDTLLKFVRVPTLIIYGNAMDKLCAGDPSFLADVVMDGTLKTVLSAPFGSQLSVYPAGAYN